MKKLATLTAFSLLAMLIVLPGTCFVNYSPSTSVTAEGWPLPWPGPPMVSGSSNNFLTAEGWPLPWPRPPLSSVAV
jgi:hypothetical protein